VVFNLVESLGGSDALAHLVPAVLDVIGIPYTGAPTDALFLTNHKLLAKQRLRGAGLPTPDWVCHDSGRHEPDSPHRPAEGFRPDCGYVVKAVCEHASFGLEEDALVQAEDKAALQTRLAARVARLGRPCFAERYVEGREFNLSLLAAREGPEALPPAEIDFSAFPSDKPRLVGCRAKWDEASFEFQHTPRRFDFPASDQPLLDRLRGLARECWDLFGLRGYARVDFRVDAAGKPWVLEINANPCLSPDAGFAAALDRAGIRFEEGIARILADL
jgi:D-alanine-D-alanine ligase